MTMKGDGYVGEDGGGKQEEEKARGRRRDRSFSPGQKWVLSQDTRAESPLGCSQAHARRKLQAGDDSRGRDPAQAKATDSPARKETARSLLVSQLGLASPAPFPKRDSSRSEPRQVFLGFVFSLFFLPPRHRPRQDWPPRFAIIFVLGMPPTREGFPDDLDDKAPECCRCILSCRVSEVFFPGRSIKPRPRW
ncbi:hypothetical protein GQ53DRAFT_334724 [Thozetella sp. PMI_491]|nr:hypothetical protein GQ53DRAFT_334724 [Thozetella sp. PMI_491]